MEDPGIKGTIHIPEERYFKYIDKKKLLRSSLLMLHILYRTKWVYQQFLKLYAFKVIPELSDSYVLVDSDTIFLRDIPFDSDKFFL